MTLDVKSFCDIVQFMEATADRKLFLGGRLKRLRRDLALTQTAMAADLGVSPSYLNHIERNQRPVSAQLLLRLADTYDVDLRTLGQSGGPATESELAEAFADPLFQGLPVPRHEIVQLAEDQPAAADALLRLYRAFADRRAARDVGLGPVAGAAVGEGAIEAQQGVGGGGLVLGQLDDLVAGHGQALEQGIGEGLGQFRFGRGAAGLAEGAQIDVIGVGQTQQQLGRNGPLVALYVIKIAGRNAKVRRHGRLGQRQIAAKPLEAASQEQLAVGGRFHDRTMSQNDLTASVIS